MALLTDEQVASLRAMPITEKMPCRLQAAMVMASKSRQDLCAELNLSYPVVSDAVRGIVRTMTVARALANYFGCGIDDLFPSKGITVGHV